MTNTQHTPGPWRIDAAVYRHAPQIVSEGGSFIANTHSHNARLIAAAPELLAALIDAVAMMDAIARGRWNWDGSTEGQARSTAKDARAAIAKATGK